MNYDSKWFSVTHTALHLPNILYNCELAAIMSLDSVLNNLPFDVVKWLNFLFLFVEVINYPSIQASALLLLQYVCVIVYL